MSNPIDDRGQQPRPEPVPDQIGRLGDGDDGVYRAAVCALLSEDRDRYLVVDHRVAPALTAALASDDPRVRAGAATVLCMGYDGRSHVVLPEAVAAALAEGLTQPGPMVRRMIVEALHRADVAIPALAVVLRDEDEALRTTAAILLARHGHANVEGVVPALVAELCKSRGPYDSGPRDSYRLGQAMRAVGVAAVPALIERLLEGGRGAEIAAGWLAEQGREAALPALLDVVQNPAVRGDYHVYYVLLALGNVGGISHVLTAIEDPEPDVRQIAGHVLTTFARGDEKAAIIEALERRLAAEPVETVRDGVARDRVDCAAGVAELTPLLRHAHPRVRVAAAVALGAAIVSAGKPYHAWKAEQALRSALAGDDAELRDAAADALRHAKR